MKIAIIGAGNVGSALSTGWTARGHDVTFGLRDPNDPKHSALARRKSIGEAARAADVIVLATPPGGTIDAVNVCGDLAGKVIIDCTNPFNDTLTGVSASVTPAIANAARGAHVVKAFNTTGAPNMATAGDYSTKLAMFFCGDDAGAKATVATLIRDLAFEPVDVGPLALAPTLEHLALIWVSLAIHQKQGVGFGYAIARKSA